MAGECVGPPGMLATARLHEGYEMGALILDAWLAFGLFLGMLLLLELGRRIGARRLA